MAFSIFRSQEFIGLGDEIELQKRIVWDDALIVEAQCKPILLYPDCAHLAQLYHHLVMLI
jgi:hypothetical protein